ncbi:site-2 protease family protein [Myroides odoratus]|uniref:site-2 protease family protein n=1 Tax=Myroides odoratus TaxID=256 RepID=UPI0039B0C64B
MIINRDLLLEINLIKVNDSFYTVGYGNNVFSVGAILYDTLKHVKEGGSISDAKIKINEKYKTEISESFINEEIVKFTRKLTASQEKKGSNEQYIYMKVKILGKKAINLLTYPFLFLFNKFFFIFLVLTAIGCSFLLLKNIYSEGILNSEVSLSYSFWGIILTYLGFCVLGLFHELGHATASRYFGKPSQQIGFGFYLIFPVFYTDVTQIWQISNSKRVIVNLAGIYFQLLINILLFVLYVYASSMDLKIIIKFFFVSNVILLVYSLNPFLRNDGYWVYSDLFNIPNLMSQAALYPKKMYSILKNRTTLKEKLKFIFNNKALGVYSVFLYIVFSLFIFLFIWLTYQNILGIIQIYFAFDTLDLYSYQIYFKLFRLLFGLTINVYFLRVILKRFFRKKRNLLYSKQ